MLRAERSAAAVASPPAVVRALVALSQRDLLFADRYLYRAETRLQAVCSREQLAAFRADERALTRAARTVHEAIERGEWAPVGALAHEAALLQACIDAGAEIAALAALVYERRPLDAVLGALALNGVIAGSPDVLARERAALLEDFRTLIAHDAEWAAFYRQRLAELCGALAPDSAQSGPDQGALRERALRATARADFAEVERIAAGIEQVVRTTNGRRNGEAAGRGEALARPFPPVSVERAGALGLGLETLPEEPHLCACVSHWCRADRSPVAEGSADEMRLAATGACGRACPPAMRPTLWNSLDLLLVRPFVTSAGTRYVPRFGAERLLVETFPETEPDARSPLLELLGFTERRGLARSAVEAAIRRGSHAVCATLGLDPLEFTLVCIPFDAYLRLAPCHGWGRQPLWTHFDGYQLTLGHHLRALVGGDVRYGGADDLCSVGCDYESEHVVLRLGVLRRARLDLPAAGRV